MSLPAGPSWKRLGELLVRRRIELDPSYANRQAFVTARGVNYRTVYDIEAGRRENYEPATITSLEVAYGVAPGSIRRTLEGSELEPLAAGAPRIAAVPAPPPGAGLGALDRLAALIAGATPAGLEMLDAAVGELVRGDEMLEALHQAPDPRRLGERLPLLKRIALMRAWMADDPRRALDEESRRGTALFPSREGTRLPPGNVRVTGLSRAG